MKEELYIYDKDGVRQYVDLNTPSGITLKWVSNLFNSLDKVNSSYSYTFTIPMTRHNREVFDYVEDIRHVSGLLGNKVKAEFIQNGFPLFSNGNLYIEKATSNSYSCVFTWNVIEGLQKLKDDGCSLNELRDALIKAGEADDELTDEGWVSGGDKDSSSTETFYNRLKTLHPYYKAGVPFILDYKTQGEFDYGQFSDCFPRPVMPTKYLLNAIEKAFGLKFKLGEDKAGEDDLKVIDNKDKVFEGENIVSYGCVPLVNSDLTDNQLKLFTMSLEPSKVEASYFFIKKHKILGQENVLIFKNGDTTFDAPQDDKPYIFNLYMNVSDKSDIGAWVQMREGTNLTKIGFATPYEAEVELKFRVKSELNRYLKNAEDDKKVQLVVFSRKTKDNSTEYEYEEITKLKPSFIETHYKDGGNWDYDILTFDTVESEGFDVLSVGEEQTSNSLPKSYFFKLNLGGCEYLDFEVMKITPKINDAKYITHYMDTFTNLPDIDCLAFVKSLFYMMGKYPQMTNNGVIYGLSYNTLRENIENGYVYDWSMYVINRTINAEEISYNVDDFKQNNYYMTSWDDLDRTEEDLEDEEDVYDDGILNIKVNDKSLDDEQTVYQSPFYPPYILNRKHPAFPTGNTVKAWDFDMADFDEPITIMNDGSYLFGDATKVLSMCESKPAYGILHCRPLSDDATVRYLRMDVLNPFKDAPSASGLAYLQEIVKHPFVITEKLRLNEYVLMDIDFSRPVYIDKYNSYFAIVSIQRDSKGICKCELIKLPTS